MPASTASDCDQQRKRQLRDVAGNEPEALATRGDPEGLGDTVESGRTHVAEQGVHGRGVVAGRPVGLVTDPHDEAGVGHPAVQHLLVR